jgi:hypothetical protein
MNRKNALLMALAMLGTCGALAQPIYKSIGPDGKVVYSDKPPAGADTKSTVIAVPVKPAQSSATTDAARRPAGASVEESSSPASAKKATAKKAIRAEPPRDEAPASASAAPAMDPALEKAVIVVMSYEDLVQRMEDVCTRTLITSFKKYNTAAVNWRQRNAALVSQSRRVLSDAFNASQRQNIEAGVKAKNQQIFEPVLSGSTAAKIKWCDQSADEINNGVMDVQNKPNLSSPLMNYRPKSK